MVVDASVFVRAVRKNEEHHQSARAWLQRALTQGTLLHAPIMLPVEVAASIARRERAQQLALTIARDIARFPRLILYPLDTPLALHAIRFGVDTYLKSADAVYAALAEQLGVPLISWDGEHLTRAAPRIRVYTTDTAP